MFICKINDKPNLLETSDSTFVRLCRSSSAVFMWLCVGCVRCMCLSLSQMEALQMGVKAAIHVFRTCPSVCHAGRAVRAVKTAPRAGCRRIGFSGPGCWPSRGCSCSSSLSACWWPTGIGGIGWVRSFGSVEQPYGWSSEGGPAVEPFSALSNEALC